MLVLKLKRYGFYEVNFAGGEPLLNTHLGDYLVYAKSIGLKTSLTPTFQKMTETWRASYGRYIDQIGVSCDSMGDAVNKALGRGFGNHVEVQKGLSHVLRH